MTTGKRPTAQSPPAAAPSPPAGAPPDHSGEAGPSVPERGRAASDASTISEMAYRGPPPRSKEAAVVAATSSSTWPFLLVATLILFAFLGMLVF